MAILLNLMIWFLILVISFLTVAASLSLIVAEETNMRELSCLLPKSHLCVVSGRMKLLILLCVRLSAAAVISLYSPVFRCCFRALHFVRSAATLPGRSVDVDNLHISYADIFISQVWAAGCSPQCQLTVEDVFWNATILHSANATQPSKYSLSQQNTHTGNTSTRQTGYAHGKNEVHCRRLYDTSLSSTTYHLNIYKTKRRWDNNCTYMFRPLQYRSRVWNDDTSRLV